MRYGQGGGLMPGEQEKRERLRLEAAERFGCGGRTEGRREGVAGHGAVGAALAAGGEEGDTDALRSKGPVSVEPLRPGQREFVERD